MHWRFKRCPICDGISHSDAHLCAACGHTWPARPHPVLSALLLFGLIILLLNILAWLPHIVVIRLP